MVVPPLIRSFFISYSLTLLLLHLCSNSIYNRLHRSFSADRKTKQNLHLAERNFGSFSFFVYPFLHQRRKSMNGATGEPWKENVSEWEGSAASGSRGAQASRCRLLFLSPRGLCLVAWGVWTSATVDSLQKMRLYAGHLWSFMVVYRFLAFIISSSCLSNTFVFCL